MGSDGGPSLADELEKAIRNASGNCTVRKIRLAAGEKLSVSRLELAKELHARFPNASVEILDSKVPGAVVVKDIEVD